MGDLRHNCGFCVTHTLHDAYNFLKSLQHRGREAVGIAGIGETIDTVKWAGAVTDFKLETLEEILDRQYHTYLGHVRYATSGRKEIDQLLQDAHPIALGGYVDKRIGHIIITGSSLAIVHNGQVNDCYFDGVDLGKLETGTDTEKLLRLYDQIKEKELLRRVPGSYTMAIAEKGNNGVMVIRDRTGIKPGILGIKDTKYVVASEDIAFMENGAKAIEELDSGTIYYIDPDGHDYTPELIVSPSHRYCFFEQNYIAHVESTLSGIKVRVLRQELGKKLAKESAKRIDLKTIDYVTFLPSCPEVAARSFAKELGIPFLDVFYKKTRERAFQGSNQKDRENSIKLNLNLKPGIKRKIIGRNLVVIDDSAIRGTNSTFASQLLRTAEVKEAYFENYTPQIGIIGKDGKARGCEFGVDMPTGDNFLARNRTLDEMASMIGSPINFLSVDGMLEVFERAGIKPKKLCHYCIGGPHPFEGPQQPL